MRISIPESKKLTKVLISTGVIVSHPHDFYGYFGWPTVSRISEGVIGVVASGFRNSHIGPFGRTVLTITKDEGKTWSPVHVINDSPLDDRDAGLLRLSDNSLLLSWFTMHYSSKIKDKIHSWEDLELARHHLNAFKFFNDSTIHRWYGSWTQISLNAGETWESPYRAPVTAPHGPVLLSSGNLLYFGKEFLRDIDGYEEGTGSISAFESKDQGRNWQICGRVPTCPGTIIGENQEPHVLEIEKGRLIGILRLSALTEERKNVDTFVNYSMAQTLSSDGGKTWSTPEKFGFHGSTPHLMRHSSGSIVLTYGYRKKPQGIRVIIGNGETWTSHFILRNDGIDTDIGYPSSVELSDGAILTVSYQRLFPNDKMCSLVWTKWELP